MEFHYIADIEVVVQLRNGTIKTLLRRSVEAVSDEVLNHDEVVEALTDAAITLIEEAIDLGYGELRNAEVVDADLASRIYAYQA